MTDTAGRGSEDQGPLSDGHDDADAVVPPDEDVIDLPEDEGPEPTTGVEPPD